MRLIVGTFVSIAFLATFARNGIVPVLFILTALLFAETRAKKPLSIDPWIASSLALFLAWCLLSSLWAESAAPAKVLALALCAVAGLTAIASVKMLNDTSIELIQRALCLMGLAAFAIFSIQFVFNYPIVRTILDPQKFPNLAGNIAVIAPMIWPLAVGAYKLTGRRGLAIAYVSFGIFTAAIGPMFAGVVAILGGLFAFLVVYKSPRIGLIAIFASLFLYMSLAPIIFKDFVTLEAFGVSAQSLRPSWYQRTEMWTFTARQVFENPIRGVGFHGSRYLGQDQFIGDTGLPMIVLHPHNAALEIWLELGLIGILLLGAVLYSLARALWSQTDRPLAAAAGSASLVTFAIIGSLSFGIWQTWWQSAAWLSALIFVIFAQTSPPRIPRASPA